MLLVPQPASPQILWPFLEHRLPGCFHSQQWTVYLLEVLPSDYQNLFCLHKKNCKCLGICASGQCLTKYQWVQGCVLIYPSFWALIGTTLRCDIPCLQSSSYGTEPITFLGSFASPGFPFTSHFFISLIVFSREHFLISQFHTSPQGPLLGNAT